MAVDFPLKGPEANAENDPKFRPNSLQAYRTKVEPHEMAAI